VAEPLLARFECYVQFKLPRREGIFDTKMNCVEFSAEDLKTLVASTVSCVLIQRRVRHISLLPKYLGDTKSAIEATLNSFQNKFDDM
jgi:hypothetical protein